MAMTIEQAMRHAAKVIELYDDALADSCEMATSTDSAEVLNALADYYAAHLTQPAQAVDVGALQKVADDLACVARLTDHDLTRGTCQSASDRITRALAGEKAEGWRDISTAPKDGTRIMLSNGHGVWMAEFHAAYPSGYRPMSPWFSVMLNHGHIPQAKRHHAPTHWQPLPTPPTDGEG